MRIFVQYENHLLPLNIQLHDAIGSVYERILTEIGVTADKIVNMFYDHAVIGKSPLDFAATALEGKIRDGAFIFVILNHYPQLTEYTCKTHHAEFLQWKNRSLIPYDVSRLNYDPVLQTLNRRPAPAPAPVPTPAPVPASALVQVPAQPVSNLGISPGVYFQNPARPLLASPPRTPSISLPSVGSSVRRRSRSRSPPRPHLRSSVTPSQLISRPLLSLLSNDIPRNSLASNLRLASSNNPMSHAVQMRSPDHAIQPRIRPPLSSFSLSQPPLPPPLSSLSLPQRPSPLSSLSPLRPPPRRNDLDQIWSSLSNHLSGVNPQADIEYRIFSRFIDVPVTLTEDEFNRLDKKPYRQVCQEYRQQHPDEIPYEHCPIERDLFNNEELVIVLGCGHYFKEASIHEWLTVQNHTCPCCNADVRDTLPGRSAPPAQQRRIRSPIRRPLTPESEISQTPTSDEEDEDDQPDDQPDELERPDSPLSISSVVSHSVRQSPRRTVSARVSQPHEQDLMLEIFALLTQDPPQHSVDISQFIDGALSSGLMSPDDAQTLINMMRMTLESARRQLPTVAPQLPSSLPPSNLPISSPLPAPSLATAPATAVAPAPAPAPAPVQTVPPSTNLSGATGLTGTNNGTTGSNNGTTG